MPDKSILILSRCLKVQQDSCIFHFKGFYRGDKIDFVRLVTSSGHLFQKGEDYLLWVSFLNIDSQVLSVKLIKHKKIR